MKDTSRRPGILFVVSAPSGTGKSTVARRIVDPFDQLEFSVSYTTREPRPGEQDGVHYHFIDEGAFRRRVDEGGFLEFAPVFGQLYGTGMARTQERLDAGVDLLLDIDVQGAGQVRCGPVPSVSIMILPPDFPTLEGRLRDRGSEREEDVVRRLAKARLEAGEYRDFDYVVINDRIDAAVDDVAAVIRAERLRSSRSRGRVDSIVATFPDDGEA